MMTCKERAVRWVYGYTVGGAVAGAVPIPIPGANSVVLVAAEAFMTVQISKIYRDPIDNLEALALLGTFEVTGGWLKTLALEACAFIPGPGWAIKGSIAGGAIQTLGRLVIGHFEKKHPNREYIASEEFEGSK